MKKRKRKGVKTNKREKKIKLKGGGEDTGKWRNEIKRKWRRKKRNVRKRKKRVALIVEEREGKRGR